MYLHDDTGDGRAATAAAMLLMLRGESRYGAIAGVGSTGFGTAQQLAIRQLGSALRPGHGPLPGNPYSLPGGSHGDHAGGVPSSRLQDGRQFRVVMATRREPTECGGVERVVAGLIAELERSRPDWRVECVAAFPAGSRIEGVDLLADVIAGLRLGWRLRNTSAEVVYVHCAEVLWGIRLLRRRRGAPRLITVWHGAGPQAYLTLRRPGHPIARLLARLRTAMERGGLAAEAHIAVHHAVADRLRSLYGFTGPVTVVENGLDPVMADQLSRSAPAREGDASTPSWPTSTLSEGARRGAGSGRRGPAASARAAPDRRRSATG